MAPAQDALLLYPYGNSGRQRVEYTWGIEIRHGVGMV